jgi:hypothetical protein
VPLRLHSGGRSRARLGALFGGDAELGDRVWRRGVHIGAAIVLVYYLIPPGFFLILPNEVVLLLALAVVLGLEVLRHLAGLELPTIRPWEARRVASFAFYAVALVVAVLVFPRAIAAGVILGAAIVDPLVGELRIRRIAPAGLVLLPLAAYVGLAVVAIEVAGRWALPGALLAAAVAAVIAVAVERPKILWLDDDLAMTLVPGIALTLLVVAWPGLPGWG